MDEQLKKDLKEKIIKEIEKVSSSIETYKELTKPIAPENAIGRVSRMDAINNKSIAENALRQAQIKLKSLQIAMDSVEDVGFGVCIRCQQPIPIGRMMLMPHSKFCVRCAS